MKTLQQLLHCVSVLETKNPLPHCSIPGLAYHSGRVEPGFLFVAIPGALTDGHRFVPMAAEKGAVAAIVEYFVDLPLPQYRVRDARKALADLACFFYDHPSRAMHMTGVTATNGKTSTTYMLDHMYEASGFSTGMVGTVVVKIGDEQIPSDLTTPESLDLQRYLASMRDKGIHKVVMEVSSSALELSRVRGVDYDAVSFGNFSREHIDQHGSFEKYWEAKSSLIKNAKQGALVLLNQDDERIRMLKDQTSAQVLTYSMKDPSASFFCRDLDLSTGRGSFTFVTTKELHLPSALTKEEAPSRRILSPGGFHVNLALPGYHSVINSMAAISLALCDGLSPAAIQAALSTFQGVERRFQYIFEENFILVDDHFANAQNIQVTFTTLQHMTYRKLHLVYAIRGNRGPTVNRENAAMVAQWKEILGLEKIIASRSRDVTGPKDHVTAEEESVFLEEMQKVSLPSTVHEELRSAIQEALSLAQDGDVVLLAGCQGMDKGAGIALTMLHQRYPQIPEEKLFAPIKDRIC